jgi:hypothetical protein
MKICKAKMHGVIRTYAVRGVSKTGKPDNKRITVRFEPWFLQRQFACQSFTRLNLHPAGLEPATL